MSATAFVGATPASPAITARTGRGPMDRDDDQDDHVADESVTVVCPYCGEPMELGVDPGGGTVQDYVEDCQVCCQPWQVHVRWRRDGHADVHVETADG